MNIRRTCWLCSFAWLILTGPLGAAQAPDNPLLIEIGRSESRVVSAPFAIAPAGTIEGTALPQRLDALGYQRVRRRPANAGEYFWGHEVFWIYRRAFRHGGDGHKALLFGLVLGNGGSILTRQTADGRPMDRDAKTWLEPQRLAESLDGDRAVRVPIRLADLPERVWRPLLAAEDARFFDHMGVDGRSLARALLANVKAGKVSQGGSTITQQLIKNRELTPKRSLGRKASEALRALALEARYDKEQILEAYLDHVYLGHLDGLAIHGYGAAAQAYFSRDAARLELAEAATLAAMIQGPNRLSPIRHSERLRQRRNWVLARMQELGWATAAAVSAAQDRPVELRRSPVSRRSASRYLAWLKTVVEQQAPARVRRGRGVVVESTLDPLLQRWAEQAVSDRLDELRQRRQLREAQVSAALITIDADTGDVLAYVGGDPRERRGFDRVRQAHRQPGSAIKPLLLLEAFESCGRREPLTPASRIDDSRLQIDLPDGSWAPRNADGEFHGTVFLRQALSDSLNVPFVRLSRWCGFEATADRMRDLGLDLPKPAPPSFTLGAVETSPLALATAYTAIAGDGRWVEPRPISRLERPGGRQLERSKPQRHKAVSPATAYLVHDLMRQAANQGTAKSASFNGAEVAAKTGTTSDRRDAWLAGHVGNLVTVVWIGRDDGKPLGLTGSGAAAPLWRAYMQKVTASRAQRPTSRPNDIVERFVDSRTGLLVRGHSKRAFREIFRRGDEPRRKRFWRNDQPSELIE